MHLRSFTKLSRGLFYTAIYTIYRQPQCVLRCKRMCTYSILLWI